MYSGNNYNQRANQYGGFQNQNQQVQQQKRQIDNKEEAEDEDYKEDYEEEVYDEDQEDQQIEKQQYQQQKQNRQSHEEEDNQNKNNHQQEEEEELYEEGTKAEPIDDAFYQNMLSGDGSKQENNEEEAYQNHEHGNQHNYEDEEYESKQNFNQLHDIDDFLSQVSLDLKDDRVSEALDACQQYVLSAQQFKSPSQLEQIVQQILKFLNQESVVSLNQSQFDKTLFCLNKAKEIQDLSLTRSPSPLIALTFNNFGCYYRRIQQLPKALGCLEQALKYLNSINSKQYIGMTYLNISAVLSQMGEHLNSLDNAKKAVFETHKIYQEVMSRKDSSAQQDEIQDSSQALAIAFYNVGVEQEFFKNYDAANTNYGKSCQVAQDNLGPNHRLTKRFEQLHSKFKEKVSKLVEKEQMQKDAQQKRNPVYNPRKLIKRPTSGNASKSQFNQNRNSKDPIQDRINPFKQAYGVKAGNFIQNGNNLNFKNQKGPTASSSTIFGRPSTAKSTTMSQPFPSSNMIKNPPNSFQNFQPFSQKQNSQGNFPVLSRPASAQVYKNVSKTTVLQNPQPMLADRPKSAIVNNRNPSDNKSGKYNNKEEPKKQNDIYDWDEDDGQTFENNQEVAENQKTFLKNIQESAELNIRKLQEEEKELKQRIEAMKQQNLKEEKEKQEKREQEELLERERRYEEEEKAKKEVEEIKQKKKKEEDELLQIKEKKEKEERHQREMELQLEQLKKQAEQDLKLKQAEKERLLKELQESKREEERRLEEIRKKNEEESRKLEQLERKNQELQELQKQAEDRQKQQEEYNLFEENKLKEGAEQLSAQNEQLKNENQRLQGQLKQFQSEQQRLKEESLQREKEAENSQSQRQEIQRQQEEERKQKEAANALKQKQLEEERKEREAENAWKQKEDELKDKWNSLKYLQRKNLDFKYDIGIVKLEEQTTLRIYAIPLLLDIEEFYTDISTDLIEEKEGKREVIDTLASHLIQSVDLDPRNNVILFDQEWKETISDNIYSLIKQGRFNEWKINVEEKPVEQVIGKFGISEDPESIKKVTMIQNKFKNQKQKEKAREDVKKAVGEIKQPLFNKVIQHKKYKFFLQAFKQISPPALVIQLDSLNPKNSQLPKINCSEEVEQEYLDRVSESQNPFEDELFSFDERNNTVRFNKVKEEKKQDEEAYEEEFFEEEEAAQADNSRPPDESHRTQDQNEHHSEKEEANQEENKKEEQEDEEEEYGEDKDQKEEKEEQEEEDRAKQENAAVVIQKQVITKKETKAKKKEKIVLFQVFVQEFNQKFIFQLFRKVRKGKLLENISFENLLKKPAHWFSKLQISQFLSQELITKSKEREFSPLDYILFEERVIVMTEKARDVAVKFIQKFYGTYFKEVFFKVEKINSSKYIFCLQKVSQKKKEPCSTYRIRVESMKNRAINSICTLHIFIAKYIVALQRAKMLSYENLFDIDPKNLMMKIKKDKEQFIFEQALKRLIKIRVKLNEIRANVMAITYYHKTSMDDYPRNSYFFQLAHYKNPNKFMAIMDSIKCQTRHERYQCRTELKSYEYRHIMNEAKNALDYQSEDYFDYSIRENTMSLKEEIKTELRQEVAKSFLLKVLAKRRNRPQINKLFKLTMTTTFRNNKTLFAVFIVQYLTKGFTEIRFERLSSWQSKSILKMRNPKFFARLQISEQLARTLGAQQKLPENQSDPKRSFLFKYLNFDMKELKLSLINEQDYSSLVRGDIPKAVVVAEEEKDDKEDRRIFQDDSSNIRNEFSRGNQPISHHEDDKKVIYETYRRFVYQNKDIFNQVKVEYAKKTNTLHFSTPSEAWEGCQKKLEADHLTDEEICQIAEKDCSDLAIVEDKLQFRPIKKSEIKEEKKEEEESYNRNEFDDEENESAPHHEDVSPKVILENRRVFNYERKNIFNLVRIEYSKKTNTLTYTTPLEVWGGCEKKLEVDKPTDQELLHIAEQDFKNLILVDDKLQIAHIKEIEAAKILQKQRGEEQIIRQQSFQIRISGLSGVPQVIEGECRLTRKMRNYSLAIYKKPGLEIQQKIELGELSKQKKQLLIKNFSNLISTSITSHQNGLIFEGLPDFQRDEPIRQIMVQG